MSAHEHHARHRRSVGCAVVTVSDTRTAADDASGTCIRTRLEEAGHRVVAYAILRRRADVEELLATPEVEAVIVNGGTGLARRDTTYEALAGLFDKRLDGFGELFRMLSYQEIGAAAMLSRAAAGIARGKVLASLPGAPPAVELALVRLLVPELTHMVDLLRG